MGAGTALECCSFVEHAKLSVHLEMVSEISIELQMKH